MVRTRLAVPLMIAGALGVMTALAAAAGTGRSPTQQAAPCGPTDGIDSPPAGCDGTRPEVDLTKAAPQSPSASPPSGETLRTRAAATRGSDAYRSARLAFLAPFNSGQRDWKALPVWTALADGPTVGQPIYLAAAESRVVAVGTIARYEFGLSDPPRNSPVFTVHMAVEQTLKGPASRALSWTQWGGPASEQGEDFFQAVDGIQLPPEGSRVVLGLTGERGPAALMVRLDQPLELPFTPGPVSEADFLAAISAMVGGTYKQPKPTPVPYDPTPRWPGGTPPPTAPLRTPTPASSPVRP